MAHEGYEDDRSTEEREADDREAVRQHVARTMAVNIAAVQLWEAFHACERGEMTHPQLDAVRKSIWATVPQLWHRHLKKRLSDQRAAEYAKAGKTWPRESGFFS